MDVWIRNYLALEGPDPMHHVRLCTQLASDLRGDLVQIALNVLREAQILKRTVPAGFNSSV